MKSDIYVVFPVAALALAAGGTQAQNFPSRVVRIVTVEAGASGDLVGRLTAQGLSATLGQQVIIENRGINAPDVVVSAAPDGHTLLLYGGTLWIGPLIQNDVRWDVQRDFVPVTWATNGPNALVVHPSLPVKSTRELLALAKARPGQLNYSSGSLGASTHLAAELFKSMAGVDIVRINYKGGGPAVNAVMAGEVQLMFTTPATADPHLRAGKLRMLAVTSAKPSPLAPGIPTVAQTVPGYESSSMFGIFAPAKTPPALVQQLNAEIVKVLNRPDVKDRIFRAGVEVIASTPEEFASAIRTDMAKWTRLFKNGVK